MDKFITAVIPYAACCVLAVSAVPGFAQTNTGSERRVAFASISAVHTYDAVRSASYDDVTMPRNLTVTNLYQAVVEEMLRRSPTFRRQCARIARASDLTIDLRSDAGPGRRRANAWTTIQRQPDGRLHAVMTITPAGAAHELIAHELEHVIEQLDGVNLSEKVLVNASGVRHCDCGDTRAYETTRAIQTGQRVALDMERRSP
jgi:hypothetical protein